ncbi:MAG: TldD/PmbA family protein [Thermosyntropha sp.]|nr:TldD/PmbA family protein [Thermosyntropha sp.]
MKVEAEAFLMHNRELNIEVANGKVETLKQAEEKGLGIRVINNGKLGFVYTSDLSDRALKEAVISAVYISKYMKEDEHNVLTSNNQIYHHLSLYDPDIEKESLKNKIELAKEAEKAALSADPRINIIEKAGYEDNFFTSVIMNTNGLTASASANFCGSYIFLVAEENGDAQNGFSMMLTRRLKGLSPEQIGKEAAFDALRSLNPKSITTGKMTCIMEPSVVTRFLGIIASMVNADAVQKGKSMLEGKIGEKVASDNFTLIDDGLCEKGVGAFPFDGEGTASSRKVLIENGVLKGFLYDNYTASKEGKKSTGNGQRRSFRTLPGVGTTNFMVKPGEKTPDELISDIKRGFYITEVIGMHTANPITGEFSVGAAGIMIENGRLTYPVKGAAIAGNLADFLKDIEGIGNDLRFYGAKAAPTIRIKSLSIAGD